MTGRVGVAIVGPQTLKLIQVLDLSATPSFDHDRHIRGGHSYAILPLNCSTNSRQRKIKSFNTKHTTAIFQNTYLAVDVDRNLCTGNFWEWDITASLASVIPLFIMSSKPLSACGDNQLFSYGIGEGTSEQHNKSRERRDIDLTSPLRSISRFDAMVAGMCAKFNRIPAHAQVVIIIIHATLTLYDEPVAHLASVRPDLPVQGCELL
jgi:hypothetical protein